MVFQALASVIICSALLALASAFSPEPKKPQSGEICEDVTLDKFQWLGTHNSYTLACKMDVPLKDISILGVKDKHFKGDCTQDAEGITEMKPTVDTILSLTKVLPGVNTVEELYASIKPATRDMPTLQNQLLEGITMFELDAQYKGHNYGADATQFPIYHSLALDIGTTCTSLESCLTDLKHGRDELKSIGKDMQAPIIVQLELKDSAIYNLISGMVNLTKKNDNEIIADLNDAILASDWTKDEILKPWDIISRDPSATYPFEAVQQVGWPKVSDVSGKLIVVVQNNDAALHSTFEDEYIYNDYDPARNFKKPVFFLDEKDYAAKKSGFLVIPCHCGDAVTAEYLTNQTYQDRIKLAWSELEGEDWIQPGGPQAIRTDKWDDPAFDDIRFGVCHV
jgi:hypothetical protein